MKSILEFLTKRPIQQVNKKDVELIVNSIKNKYNGKTWDKLYDYLDEIGFSESGEIRYDDNILAVKNPTTGCVLIFQSFSEDPFSRNEKFSIDDLFWWGLESDNEYVENWEDDLEFN